MFLIDKQGRFVASFADDLPEDELLRSNWATKCSATAMDHRLQSELKPPAGRNGIAAL